MFCVTVAAAQEAAEGSSCEWHNYLDINILLGENPEALGNFDSLSLCQEACTTATSFECASVLYYTDTYM